MPTQHDVVGLQHHVDASQNANSSYELLDAHNMHALYKNNYCLTLLTAIVHT